jgi:hypothetical protein
MKKIFLFLRICFISGFIMSSCIYEQVPTVDEDDGNNNGNHQDQPVKYRISASLSETALGQTIESKTIGLFLKNPSDKLLLSNNPVSLDKDRYNELTPLGAVDSIGYCYAYYPYNSSAVNNNIYTGSISASQDQAVSASTSPASVPPAIADQLLMISNNSGNTNFNQDPARLQFRNVFSLMRFEITANTEIFSLPDFLTQRIKRFEMYISNGRDTLNPIINLVGEYTIDVSKEPGSADYIGPRFSDRSPVITANISESPVISASTPIVVWIAIPPVTNMMSTYKLVVRMELEDANQISYRTFSTVAGMGNIDRNSLVAIPIVLTGKNLYSEEAVKASFADRPANSYVIPEPGVYEIAMKKPSGEALADGDSVDWLWASKAGGGQFEIEELINDISLDRQNGKIRFRAGSEFSMTEGNVVLALKNAAKEIVWTWHLWITGDLQDVLSENGGKSFIDRNLGALSADTASASIDTYGFVYQWGRKAPFFGGDGLTTDESGDAMRTARSHTIVNDKASWKDADVNKWSKGTRSAYGTAEQAAKYPMKFIYHDHAPVADHDPADWLKSSNARLWSDTEKTDEDPCPYGYKVPSGYKVANPSSTGRDFSVFHDVAYPNYLFYLNSLNDDPSTQLQPVWFYNHTNSNRYWIYAGPSDETAWPAGGMREGRDRSGKWNGAQLKYSGTESSMGWGYYWTSTPLEIVGGQQVAGASSRICIHNTILYSRDDFGPNADAYPIRCVKYTAGE